MSSDEVVPLRRRVAVCVFVVLGVACLLPWASPPLALGAGLAFALLAGGAPFPWVSRATKLLLQASVVGLGFGLSFGEVWEAGRRGAGLAVATIVFALSVGWGLGWLLRTGRRVGHLIASGTAICGGSAIAAVGPACNATDAEMSVALGTVFVLNAVALFVFPPVGHALGMSPGDFGVWAAVAIHDTSSVVGAAKAYDPGSLGVATTVKLARAIWIVPLALGTAWAFGRRGGKTAWPWFVFFFLGASVVRSLVPSGAAAWDGLARAARVGLTLTLFLIGTGLSRSKLKSVGWRPMLQGVLLWIVVATTTLLVIRSRCGA